MEKNKNLIGISSKLGGGKDTVAKMIQYHIHHGNHGFKCSDEEGIPHWLSLNYSMYPDEYQIHRFADKLKQIVSLLTGIPREDLEKEEVKSSFLPQEWNYIMKAIRFEDKFTLIPGIVDESMRDREHIMTVRELLQKLGTNACRNHIHENIWVNSLFVDYKSTEFNQIHDATIWPSWIIPDLRFKNEFQAIKDRGGLTIRIERDYDKKNSKFNHQSETDLDNYRDQFDYIIDNNSSIEMLAKQVKTILQLEGII